MLTFRTIDSEREMLMSSMCGVFGEDRALDGVSCSDLADAGIVRLEVRASKPAGGRPCSTTPSRRQADVVDAIRAFITKHGYSPTVREIADGIGVSSLNTVAGHLMALRRKGFVTWSEGAARTIRIVSRAE
jgi:repressor LexA